MKFTPYIPCDALKPFVHLFVVSETVEERIYKVLPDTAIVLGFQYKGQLCYLDDRAEMPLSSSGVTGLTSRYKIFKNTPDIGTVLVFFKVTGASAFFKEPLHEFFGASIALDTLILRSELILLQDMLCEMQTDVERIGAVEQFLLARMRPVEPDPVVLSALSLILEHRGNIKITDMLKSIYVSQSALERRFRKAVGASPKKFASIVRFKHLVDSRNFHGSMTELGYEAGFYDQAHFIKEFKNFTGEAPEVFFRLVDCDII